MASSAVQATSSATLSDQVFRLLLAAIVRGEIAAGSKISEPELAQFFHKSKKERRK